MLTGRVTARGLRRTGNAFCAMFVAVLLLAVLGAGYGPLPALGRALVPGSGVWAASADRPVRDATLRLAGLRRPATVSYAPSGFTTIHAASADDGFMAQGYVTATARLPQMDLVRRAGEGRLAELNGPSMVDSDAFELRLGLERTARAQWAALAPDSPTRRALTAYANGVNAYLDRLDRSGRWPSVYALTGVRPARWTPIDSLVVQEVLTQQLSFTTTPLDHELLRRALGTKRAAKWFPVVPATETARQPYDPGPYRYTGVAPLEGANANAAPPGRTENGPAHEAHSAPTPRPTAVDRLPPMTHRAAFASNAWAVNGPRASGGGALLAGDPHLDVSLPSYWFEVSIAAPGYAVSGAAVPGMPAVVIGHNSRISWSITNAVSQSTLFYRERTNGAHPGSYYWRGSWRRMREVRYRIPVRGAEPRYITADQTVHGPVMSLNGQTVSVTWMGNYPSDDLGALLRLNRAADFAAFRSALSAWHAPALNFVYADRSGHIGAIGAGYYPQTPRGVRQWLPMPGTGSADLTGTIPYAAVPQAHDPPGHQVVSTNQRPVGASYPYYIGTSLDFDPGYRQSVIAAGLHGRASAPGDFQRLQRDVTDGLAAKLVPALLKAVSDTSLTAVQRAARARLAAWDHSMDADSAAATIWWNTLDVYLTSVFRPWWRHHGIPTRTDGSVLDLSSSPVPLREALERWTLRDPGNAAFTPPGGPHRTAPDVLRAAFTSAVGRLSDRFGAHPATWTWGRVHSRQVLAITGADALGYGPVPAGGDAWTINAADGGLTSSFGPSLRMVIGWGAGGPPDASMIYPGGQSGDPTSPWYRNLIPAWRAGRYLPLRAAPSVGHGIATWRLRPGRLK